ncbi:MAG: ImmA/IrrE family metallo-endopeptidase [Peptococcaceae bacterium]|nr:ImmA/IrrE family metallo-endopeptidase [Peptococcaceae bacterium]
MATFYIKAAKKLTRKYATRDPERIAREMGITVLYVPMSRIYGLAASLGEYKIIGVKADLPEQAQKLVIAHELGHFILHPEKNSFMFILDHTFFYGKHEYQANMFAIGLRLGENLGQYEPVIKELAAGRVDRLISMFAK